MRLILRVIEALIYKRHRPPLKGAAAIALIDTLRLKETDYSDVFSKQYNSITSNIYRGLTIKDCSALIERSINEIILAGYHQELNLNPASSHPMALFANESGFMHDPEECVQEYINIHLAVFETLADFNRLKRREHRLATEALIVKFEVITESLIDLGGIFKR